MAMSDPQGGDTFTPTLFFCLNIGGVTVRQNGLLEHWVMFSCIYANRRVYEYIAMMAAPFSYRLWIYAQRYPYYLMWICRHWDIWA